MNIVTNVMLSHAEIKASRPRNKPYKLFDE
jgi:hypothetical protein